MKHVESSLPLLLVNRKRRRPFVFPLIHARSLPTPCEEGNGNPNTRGNQEQDDEEADEEETDETSDKIPADGKVCWRGGVGGGEGVQLLKNCFILLTVTMIGWLVDLFWFGWWKCKRCLAKPDVTVVRLVEEGRGVPRIKRALRDFVVLGISIVTVVFKQQPDDD